MCPTPIGRVHSRVASLIPGALFATLISLFTGNADWIVLIGVFVLLGVALDSAFYPVVIRYQPPWMTFVLAVFEFGLLLVLANILQLDLAIWSAVVLYWIVWALATTTRIVVFPIVSVTYLESAAEFRRIQWSIPASQASVPILAAPGGPGGGAGLFEEASAPGASAISQPLSKQPSPSGIHQSPVAAAAAADGGGGSALRLVQAAPNPGQELVVRDQLTIGREGCDVSLDDALVSRRHASLSRAADGLTITDLDSSNGTYVDGKQIVRPQRLSAGDEVRVGDTTWRVEAAAGAASLDSPRGVQAGQVTSLRGSISSPKPSDPMPSAIQRFPGFAPGQATPEFSAPAPGRRTSAARRLEATVVAYGVTGVTGIAVIAFLAAR